jgi:hypothetical protein
MCEHVFDVHTSEVSKKLKVVLLHLWRVNVKTTRGFISIPLGDFYIDKTAPLYYYKLYKQCRLTATIPIILIVSLKICYKYTLCIIMSQKSTIFSNTYLTLNFGLIKRS